MKIELALHDSHFVLSSGATGDPSSLNVEFRSIRGGIVVVLEKYRQRMHKEIRKVISSSGNGVRMRKIRLFARQPTQVSVCAISAVLFPLEELGVSADSVQVNSSITVVNSFFEGPLLLPQMRRVPILLFVSGLNENNALLLHLRGFFPRLEECVFDRTVECTSSWMVWHLPEGCRVTVRVNESSNIKHCLALAGLQRLSVNIYGCKIATVVALLRVLLERQRGHVLKDLEFHVMDANPYSSGFSDFYHETEEETQANYDAIIVSLLGNYAISSVEFRYGGMKKSKRRRLFIAKGRDRRSRGLNRWKRLQHHIEQRAAFNNAGLRPVMTSNDVIQVMAALSSSCDATLTLMTEHAFHHLVSGQPPKVSEGNVIHGFPETAAPNVPASSS